MSGNRYGQPLGPKPGSRARAKVKNVSGLGRSLVNDRKRQQKNPDISDRHTTDIEGAAGGNLSSVTQERPIDEFLNTAALADTDFTSERESNVKIISQPSQSSSTAANPYLLSKEEEKDVKSRQEQNSDKLKVPRRPQWDQEMTRRELDRLEKDAFLDWRRNLALLQENQDLLLTPFERNLEIWRQLWRVVDRSDLVVQIVDARNPLLFRCEDLDYYVLEVNPNKRNLLLINKADLMTKEQRQIWANYFKHNNINFAFFSASTALIEQEQNAATTEGEETQEGTNSSPVVGGGDPTDILTVNQLEELFLREAPNEPLYQGDEAGGRLQIGLVGYPNVGKSSTINALIGSKKVSVSATPGKTKHFQTILLSPKVMLCDCPGLVFPNFASTKADLVCNGVLPIDELREYTGPVEIVTSRVPKFFLEAIYGISINVKPIDEGGSGTPTAHELLAAYARARGYMRQGKGVPDESRAARYILKDYVNSKLLYCQPPPDYEDSPNTFNSQLYSFNSLPESRRQQILTAIKNKRNVDNLSQDEIDDFNLSQELADLKFSQHDPTSTLKTEDMISPESAMLDNEFFADQGARGHTSLPFHLRKQNSDNGKKHNKKNKKKGKMMA